MERAMMQAALLGLLLTCVTTAPTSQGRDWDIYSFHINATVTGRYATTVITSRVANRLHMSKEIEFHVQIPKNAFITKFRMTMKGETYDGVVKQKEEAEKQYSRAVSRGQSAGIVSSVGRTLEDFRTAVTVAASSKVTFELTYEELLKRRLGKYELLVHTRPMQPVSDFKVDVYISEKPGINFLETKGGLSKSLANAITSSHANDQAWVHFYPTLEQQKTCGAGCGEAGLNGDLVVAYDVNRDDAIGDLVESDGYFVHHFAPKDLPRIPKNVVFLIDRSGSMHGGKMQQTRDAMVKILGDLAEDDYFGLITFDSALSTWKTELVQANAENLDAAKIFARSITDRGATDINAAVLSGAELLNRQPREGSASILILLTDGDPTTGVTNLKTIQANVREAIGKRFPLYCLGFGFDVNFEFLSSMALENSGVARRIYPDSDAALQLQGFYEEVAMPLLTDVQMIYIGGENLTQTNFSQYYNGSEIVVAGQITNNDLESFTTQVIGLSKSQKVEFGDKKSSLQPKDHIANSSISRVWAYLTVKQLLDREVQYSGSEKERAKEKALQLALQYGFVTPHTSMVVTKPEGDDTHVAHKPREGEKHTVPVRAGTQSHGGRPARPAGNIPASGVMDLKDLVRADFFDDPDEDLLLGSPGRPAAYPVSPGVGPVTRGGAPGSAPGGAGVYHNAPPAGGFQVSSDIDVDYDDTVEEALLSEKSTRIADLGPSGPVGPYGPVGPLGPSGPFPTITVMPPPPTRPAPTMSVSTHRFLMPAVGSAVPLCVDLPAKHIRILHNPDNECTVDGHLGSHPSEGFRKIVIHYQNVELTLEVSSSPTVSIKDEQGSTSFPWADGATTDRIKDKMVVIVRAKEMDITIGDSRILIVLNKNRGGVTFMWPALRQRPSGSITGLIAGRPVSYEEIQGTASPTLKINDQDFIVTSSSAVDLGLPSMPSVGCWLLPLQSAQQSGVLSGFTAEKGAL